MKFDSESIASGNSNVVDQLREANEEKWENLAEETILTKRQLEMWELAIVYGQPNRYLVYGEDIHVTTVARHCERVREKRDELEEKIEKLENTLEYFKETGTMDA